MVFITFSIHVLFTELIKTRRNRITNGSCENLSWKYNESATRPVRDADQRTFLFYMCNIIMQSSCKLCVPILRRYKYCNYLVQLQEHIIIVKMMWNDLYRDVFTDLLKILIWFFYTFNLFCIWFNSLFLHT